MELFNKDPCDHAPFYEEWQWVLDRVVAQSSLNASWNTDGIDPPDQDCLPKLCGLSGADDLSTPIYEDDLLEINNLDAVITKQHAIWFNHLAAVHNEIDFMKAVEIMNELDIQ